MKLITVELDLLIDDRINLDVLKESYRIRAALANIAAGADSISDSIEHRYLDIRITDHTQEYDPEDLSLRRTFDH